MAFGDVDSRTAYELCTILIMGIFTIIRLWTQYYSYRRTRTLMKSDIFSSVCLVLVTAFVITQCSMSLSEIMATRHFDDQPNADELWFEHDFLPSTMFSTFFQLTLHSVSVWLLKGCYVGYFFSMSSVLSKPLRISLYSVAVYCTASLIATILIITLWCMPEPIRINWYPVYDFEIGAITTCRVFNNVLAFKILTGLNIAGDLLIATLSIAIINSVKIHRRSEIVAIAVVVVVGLLSIVAAIGRLVLFLYLYTSQDESRFTLENIIWIQLLVRIEVLFGTLAYGFAFGRVIVKKFVEGLVRLGSKISGGSSNHSRSRVDAHVSRTGSRKGPHTSSSLASLSRNDSEDHAVHGKEDVYQLESVRVSSHERI